MGVGSRKAAAPVAEAAASATLSSGAGRIGLDVSAGVEHNSSARASTTAFRLRGAASLSSGEATRGFAAR